MTRLALLLCLSAGCIPDGRFAGAYNDTPDDRRDGWQTGTPESVGLDAARVASAYRRWFDDDVYRPGLSLLVVRQGVLVAEGYRRTRDDADRIEHLQSATKSITALSYGLLQQDLLPDLDASVSEAFEDVLPDAPDPRIHDITPRHLMTMRSGIDYGNDRFAVEMVSVPSPQVAHILSHPFASDPGEVFWYRDADPQLLSEYATARTGRTLEDVARERVFEPLGLGELAWERTPDGVSRGAFGIWTRPRDAARIGLLVAQGGWWDGEELIPEDWVSGCIALQSETDPENEASWGYPADYGYYWWRLRGGDVVAMAGHGGQWILLVPDEELVLVHTAEPDTSGDTQVKTDEILVLLDLILE